MPVILVHDVADPRLAAYRNVPDPELLRRRGLFVAEGRLVVRRLLEMSSPRVVSLLINEAARRNLAEVATAYQWELPIYVCPPELMGAIVGFNVHRGCLALAERPANLPLEQVARKDLLLVLEAVTNADNIGSAFRNAAAFGAGGAVLSPTCCDPLYRKAIRTSMGAVLKVPYARASDWPGALSRLQAMGYTLVALTPREDALDLGILASRPNRPRRVAILLGTEGTGLSEAAESQADLRVRIPINPSVDSLNLATAAGIALHRLSRVGGDQAGERTSL